MNHLTGPNGITADVVENLSELVVRCRLEEALSGAGIHGDGRQRLVELVGE
jgi:hypothetical protein